VPQWSPPLIGGSTGANAALLPVFQALQWSPPPLGFHLMDLSRCKKYPLTCVRALPGLSITLALAAQLMAARSCMPFLMVAGEQAVK
jgi:hypothetical protein